MPTAKEAAREYPNPEVETFDDLEQKLHLRLALGAPPRVGDQDPDGVGFVSWQLALYAAGEVPFAALDFVHHILAFKQRKGLLTFAPRLLALGMPHDLALPQPWAHAPLPFPMETPLPFSAHPPRGLRHIVAQLEYSQFPTVDDAERCYLLTFTGNLYPFKERFDQCGVQGASVANEASAGGRDYVRFLELAADDPGDRQRVRDVLDGVLAKIPIYYHRMVEEGDPLSSWVEAQPSVHLRGGRSG